MARDGTKTGGRNIKKGQVLNPLGALAHDKVVNVMRRMSRDELVEVGTFILERKAHELNTLAKDQNATVLQHWIARVAINSMKKGDMYQLDVLLTRIIGKPVEKIELSGTNGNPIQYQNLTTEELNAETSAALARLQSRRRSD